MASNPSCAERNDMFETLSKLKKVDSFGRHLNNMDCKDGYTGPTDHLISQYKFMICFENTNKPNYFTEKLINAYYHGTIPIYWGCPNIEDYINMESILYLPNNYTSEDVNNLLNHVMYLDSNPTAYKNKYEQIFFKDGKVPSGLDIEKLQDKIKKITERLD
jgi:hypothetical protein